MAGELLWDETVTLGHRVGLVSPVPEKDAPAREDPLRRSAVRSGLLGQRVQSIYFPTGGITVQTTRKLLLFVACFFLTAPLFAQQGALAHSQTSGATELFRIVDSAPPTHKDTVDLPEKISEVAIELDKALVDRAPESLAFELPDGHRVTAERLRFEVEAGYPTWTGHSRLEDGRLAWVHLIDRAQRITGIINVGAERYRIVPTQTGHRLIGIAPKAEICALAHDHRFDSPTRPGEDVLEDLSESMIGASESAIERIGGDLQDAPIIESAEKAMTYIDVLALYPGVFGGTAETNVRTFIDDSIWMANTVLANSGVNARYRLLDKVKLTGPDQPEATGVLDAIEWMTPTQVGNEDVDLLGPAEVLDLRDAYAADMVALFVPHWYNEDGEVCGIANLPKADGNILGYIPGTAGPGAFGKRAYTVQRNACGLNDYTLAHELGHNLGMRHNEREDTSSQHLYPNGRGHILSSTPWQDIANGTLETGVDGNFSVGYHFTPNVDGWVVGLGGLFGGTKTVRLYRYGSGSQLASVTLTGNNTWRYEQLVRPVFVQAGVRHTVYTHIGTDGAIYSNVLPFPRTSGQIVIHGTTAVAGHTRPTNTTTDVMYGQVDIRFVPIDSSAPAAQSLDATVMGCALTDATDGTDAVCNRIPYFSDPNVQVDGLPTGTPTRNNAAVARAQAPRYAAFRSNGAPVCKDDDLSTPMDTTLPVSFGDLLNNDSDPDGDGLFLASYDSITAQGGTNSGGPGLVFDYNPPPGYSGPDWFSYTVSDRVPGHPAATTDTCTVKVDVLGDEEIIGQVGQVTNLTHVPRTLFFGRTYTSPVVIAQTLTQNGGATSVVRITDVRSSRFTFYIDEAPNKDGAHVAETVAFLVLEAGDWLLDNGARLRVGKTVMSETVGQSVTNQWRTVSYGGNFGAQPVFFSQVQTNNDPTWVKTRHFSVGTSSAVMALEKDEVNTATHGSETVGWVAMDAGSGAWDGYDYVAGRTPAAVDHNWYTWSYGSVSFPRLFAAMSSWNGGDNAGLRYQSLGFSSFDIRVEEDTTKQSETTHAAEVVDYLVLGGTGVLTGTAQ